MREYGSALLCVCLLGTLVRMLSPEGDVKRYVGLVAAFCVILAVAKPIGAAVGEEGGFLLLTKWSEWETSDEKNYAEIYDHALLDTGGSIAEEHVKSLILKEYMINEEDVTVLGKFALKNEIYQLEEVVLYLHKSTVSIDPRELTDFVSRQCGCPCYAVYEFNDEK